MVVCRDVRASDVLITDLRSCESKIEEVNCSQVSKRWHSMDRWMMKRRGDNSSALRLIHESPLCTAPVLLIRGIHS